LQTADFERSAQVSDHVGSLLAECQANEAAAAIIPWFCDALPSPKSRKDYFGDMQAFFRAMQAQAVHPLHVTGDHVRLYKEALTESGMKSASISRALSVIRGTYQQFGKKGLAPWDRVGDIQAVESPRVEKNTTPSLSEIEACRLLHAPDETTVIGIRDHAILFTYFKTACRFAAIANARIGDLERTDTDWFIVVREKGRKQRRLPLLEAAAPILLWLDVAGISFGDAEHPLFCPLERDRRTPKRRALSQQSMLGIVKRHAREIGLDVSRLGRRGICTHSLRKTALNNALEHGAKVEEVQQWAGHADIRTTQAYINYKEENAEAAARRCQIR
jgi:integrase/recombinase XerD